MGRAFKTARKPFMLFNLLRPPIYRSRLTQSIPAPPDTTTAHTNSAAKSRPFDACVKVGWFAVALVVFLGSHPPSSIADGAPMEIKGATTVDSKKVIELILNTPGMVVVDTRTKSDFESGHIEGAVNILDTEIASGNLLKAAVSSKATPVLFYCNGVRCGRAANATAQAIELGYSQVYYYALGINDWKSAHLPLATQ